MELTQTQIQQANSLIKPYMFPSLETCGLLQKAGFFEKVVPNLYLHLGYEYAVNPPAFFGMVNELQNGYDADILKTLPMPTFTEIWRALPSRISIGDYENLKCVLENQVYYAAIGDNKVDTYNADFGFTNENITEAAALLWLKIRKENLI